MLRWLALAPVAALSATLVAGTDAVPAAANVRLAPSRMQTPFHLVDAAQVGREPALAAYLRAAGISINAGSHGLAVAPRVSRGVIPNVSSVTSFHVDPSVADSPDTDTAQSTWVQHIGCPFKASQFAVGPNGTPERAYFTDAACATADQNDPEIYGFVMSKVGSTFNQSSARGTYSGLPKQFVLSELGFDIRNGSHCGAYPELVVTDSIGNTFTDNCQNIPVSQTDAAQSDPLFTGTTFSGQWTRLTTPFFLPFTVSHIAIIQASGADGDCIFLPPATQQTVVGPGNCADGSGFDVLDNFDINGRFSGKPS